MADERLQERRSIWRVGPDSTWTTVLPVAFIIISLVSLAVLPIVSEKRTSYIRREITTAAEPARRTANMLQVDVAAELDKIIAFQVTNQGQYRADYQQLVAANRRSLEQLRRYAPHLSPEVGRELETLQEKSNAWYAAVNEAHFLTKQPNEVFMNNLFERHPKYEAVVKSAADVEGAIQNSIDDGYRRIRDAERLNVTFTVVLTLLALTSAMLVAGLGRQMRLLAREAMRRRQEAEREAADAKIARATAEREERRAAFIAAAGQELTASLDLEQTTLRFARLVVPNIAEACVIDLVEPGGVLRRAAAAHRDRAKERELLQRVGEATDQPPEPLDAVMREREVKLIGATSPLIRHIDPSMEGSRSMIAVPLISRGQIIGVMLMTAPEGRVFTRDDALTAEQLARHGSLAIDNARLYQESQQAVRAREEVLAIVSHDLRNPLNAIMLGAQLLQMSESIPNEDREQVEAISISARRMRALIDDLLDVTRLEGGKQLPIEPKAVAVEELFAEAYELFKAQASASSISLNYSIGEGVPRVYADRNRIMQVLSNLIGNALKFTPPGGIISFRADPYDDAQVLFTISDTGHGIPPQNLGKIFNPYWQAKRTARLGAGLGLSITKGIVESHGGRIWVESEPEVGTKFFFTLPVARENDGEPSDATRPAESAARR